jgi:hypothetical protein
MHCSLKTARQLHELGHPTDAHMKSSCTSGKPLGNVMSHCFSHAMLFAHLLRQSISGKHCVLAKHVSICVSHFCAKHKSHGWTGSDPGHDGAHNVPTQLDTIVNSAYPVENVAKQPPAQSGIFGAQP